MTEMSAADRNTLNEAHAKLEGKNFAMTLAAKLGTPLEALTRLLPGRTQEQIGVVVNKALERCLQVALLDRREAVASPQSNRLHTLATAITGAAGGFFGLPGLAVELPVTTTVMLHSIAEIARGEGEDLSHPESALSCLEVLALGSGGTKSQLAESAYYASRAALAQVTSDAAAYIAEKGLAKEGAPALVAFLARIAARFGLEVTEKVAAQLVPVAGAAGGMALNVIFMQYFQHVAEGHFAVRRLERHYGPELVRGEYERLTAAMPA